MTNAAASVIQHRRDQSFGLRLDGRLSSFPKNPDVYVGAALEYLELSCP
jgi:hypothetical protein